MSDKAARDVAAGRNKSSGIYKRYSKREGCWVWIGRLYQDGKRYRTKPYKTKSEVKEALSRLRIDAKERKRPAEKATFAAFAAEFMEHAKLLNRNYQGHFYRMVHLKPFFKGKRLDEITRADVHRYINWRLKQGLSKGTVNRELATLKRMLNYALEIERLAVNPMTRMPMLKEEERPVRSLTLQEENQLLDFCRTSRHPVYPLIGPVITIAINTGMRLSELLELRWEQVDFLSGTITLGKTKARKVRLIPINSVANETLIKLSEEAEDEYVFPFDRCGSLQEMKERFKYHWTELRKKAGLKIRFHDLRATFATRLDRKGASAFTIKSLLGHSTLDVTKRYIGVDDSAQRAVESLAEDKIGQKIGQNSESDLERKPQIM